MSVPGVLVPTTTPPGVLRAGVCGTGPLRGVGCPFSGSSAIAFERFRSYESVSLGEGDKQCRGE